MTTRFSPNQHLAVSIFRSQEGGARAIVDYSTWCITGIAVIIGAMLVNVDAIRSAVEAPFLRVGLISLIISLVMGGACKLIGEATSNAFVAVKKAETIEADLPGDFDWSKVDLGEIEREVSSAYPWPLSQLMASSFRSGARDQLSADRMVMRLFSYTILASCLQAACAAAGLITLAMGIR